MKVIPVQQGTEEWLRARAGIPTASEFDRIVTSGGKPSAQSRQYLCRLVAERVIGLSMEDPNEWMQRGSAIEREAVAWYELERGLTTTEVGFVTTDDGRWGCSPDRMVGNDGLLEVKCPAAATHIRYLLDGGPGLAYRPQTQGQMLVAGRRWVDFVSYCPGLPPLLVRLLPDDDYQEVLQDSLVTFSSDLDDAEKLVRNGGHR